MSYTNGNEYIIKSMNGIKTYDDGSGTVIEDGAITTTTLSTGDINCSTTLTAPAVVTDFIGSNTNLAFISTASTLFDLSVLTKTASENSTKVASTAFVNTAITNLKSASNTWTGIQNFTGSTMTVLTQTAGNNTTAPATTAFVGSAITSLRTGTTSWTGTQSFTGSTITVSTQTAGTSSTAAASTAFVGTAIANVVNGETWSGTHDFTSATLKASTVSNLTNDTTVATTEYANTAVANLKSSANTWTQNQDFSGGTCVILVPTKITSDNSTNAASTAFVRACITNIEQGNSWTGSQSFTGANLTCATQLSSDNSTKVATTAFVKANSASSVSLGGNNVWTGNNTFNLGAKYGGSTGTTQIQITSDTLSSSNTNDTINLFNNNTTGAINMASNLIFKASSIASSGAGDTINLFNNNTTGAINMASNLVFKASSIGSTGSTGTISLFSNLTTGTITMASNLVLKASSIGSTGINDTISLFSNLTTGTLNIGESIAGGIINIGQNLTTTGNGPNINIATGPKSNITIGNLTNNSSASYNGCCTIAKLKLGYGTAFRGMIMGTLGLNSSAGLFTYTIPNAPTTFGNPLIFSTINANMNGNIYIVMTNPTGPTTFQYYKRYLQSGNSVIQDATSESFNYIAIWL